MNVSSLVSNWRCFKWSHWTTEMHLLRASGRLQLIGAFCQTIGFSWQINEDFWTVASLISEVIRDWNLGSRSTAQKCLCKMWTICLILCRLTTLVKSFFKNVSMAKANFHHYQIIHSGSAWEDVWQRKSYPYVFQLI